MERCASINLEHAVLTTAPTGLEAFPDSFADPVFPVLAAAASPQQLVASVEADDWPDSQGEQDGSAHYRLVVLPWEVVDPDPHRDDYLSVRQVDDQQDDRYAQEAQDAYPACLRLPAWAGSQADDLFPADRSADLRSDADRAVRLADDRSDLVAALDLRAEYSRDASR